MVKRKQNRKQLSNYTPPQPYHIEGFEERVMHPTYSDNSFLGKLVGLMKVGVFLFVGFVVVKTVLIIFF